MTRRPYGVRGNDPKRYRVLSWKSVNLSFGGSRHGEPRRGDDGKTGEQIGRPWLTMGIDVTSGMIVWFHLSLKRLDGNMLPRILYMAIRPKDMTFLRKQFPGLKSDWEVQGIFQEVVLDNSLENHTHDFQNVCTDLLNMEMHYVPPAQGSLKPHIERLFRTIKETYISTLPGAYTQDDEEKFAMRNAVLSMNKLTELFTCWVFDIYHNKYQDRLQMTPREKWKDCIAMHGSTRLPGSSRDLERLLWRSKTATLQKWGLQFETLRFKSPALLKLAQHLGFGIKLSFYYNPFDLSKNIRR